MCGIAGIIGESAPVAGAVVHNIIDVIRYRGPDDSGVWSDDALGLAIGHARLPILDLSPEGHLPMSSSSGRYVITCNGEVFNFAELFKELQGEGAPSRGHVDAEVICLPVKKWDLECLNDSAISP